MKEPIVESIKVYYSPGIPWATKVHVDGKLLVCNLLGRLGQTCYPFCNDEDPFDSLVLHVPIMPDEYRGDILPKIEFEEYEPESGDLEEQKAWEEFRRVAIRQARTEWETKKGGNK